MVEESVFAVHRTKGDTSPGELAKVGEKVACHDYPIGGDLVVYDQRCPVALAARPCVIAKLGG